MHVSDVISRLRALCCFFYCVVEHVVLLLVPDSMRTFKSVRDKVILITGAANGLGRLLALRLSARGAIIVIWDVNDQCGKSTVERICAGGGRAHYFRCDVSNRDQVYATADQVQQEVGQVYMLVNNAGVCWSQSFLNTPDLIVEKTLQVNTLAHFWTIKAFLPRMLASGSGHIVSVASLAGMQGSQHLADYCASKFAAVGVHESLMAELKATGHHTAIHTTLVCPFFINTGMFDGVETGLLPFLDADHVAGRIERATLLNETRLIIPGWLSFLLALKMILSYKCMFHLEEVFRLLPNMTNFRSRPNEKID